MSNLKVVVPRVTWSPDLSRVEPTRRPLTLTPLVEPRSAIVHSPAARAAQLGVVAGDVGVAQDAVGVARAADGRALGVEHVTTVVDGDHAPGRHFGAVRGTLGRRRRVAHRRVDHRVALLALDGGLALVGRAA